MIVLPVAKLLFAERFNLLQQPHVDEVAAGSACTVWGMYDWSYRDANPSPIGEVYKDLVAGDPFMARKSPVRWNGTHIVGFRGTIAKVHGDFGQLMTIEVDVEDAELHELHERDWHAAQILKRKDLDEAYDYEQHVAPMRLFFVFYEHADSYDYESGPPIATMRHGASTRPKAVDTHTVQSGVASRLNMMRHKGRFQIRVGDYYFTQHEVIRGDRHAG